MTRPALTLCLLAGCALQPAASLSGSADTVRPVPPSVPAPAVPADPEVTAMRSAAMFVSAALFSAGCAVGPAAGNVPIASDNAPTSQHGTGNRNSTNIYSADWIGQLLASVRELGIGILALAGFVYVGRSLRPVAAELGRIGAKVDGITARLDEGLPRRRRPPPDDDAQATAPAERRPPANGRYAGHIVIALIVSALLTGCGGMILNVTPEGAVGIADSAAVADSQVKMTWRERRPDGTEKDWTFEHRRAVNERVAVRLSKNVKDTLLAAQVLGFAAGLFPGGLPALFPVAATVVQ